MADTSEPMDTETSLVPEKAKTVAREAIDAPAADPGSADPAPAGKAVNGASSPNRGSKTSSKKRSATEAPSGSKAEGENGAVATTKPMKAKPATGGTSISGVRAYLETTVVPLLMTALQELATQKPEDPLTWLGDFLKDNAAKGNQDAAEATKKREATAAAKAATSGKGAAKASPAASKAPKAAVTPAEDVEAAKASKQASGADGGSAKSTKASSPVAQSPAAALSPKGPPTTTAENVTAPEVAETVS